MTSQINVLADYKKQALKNTNILLLMAAAVFVLTVLSVGFGSMQIGFADVVRTFMGKGEAVHRQVIYNLRMPRVLTGIISGFGLGVSGCILQSLLHNPLASASTLGVSQGASFGAAFSIVFLGTGMGVGAESFWGALSPYITTVCAFLGSMMVTFFILGLSKFKYIGPSEIVLAGVATSSIFSGFTALIQYFADDIDLSEIVFWTFGDLGRTTYKEILLIGLVVLAASVYFLFNSWNYNAINAGTNTAMGLGVNIKHVRLAGLTLASLVVSTIVSFIGVVNFIGLIAPHIMRKVVGSDNRFLVPASMLCGSIILLLSDLFARMIISPIILPIGAITSFMGAPLFVYILMRKGKKNAEN